MEGDMGMRYKGVIFDLDGVICSTDELHYLAWKEIADRYQIPFDREMNDQLRGVSRMESLERILSRGRGEWTQEQKQRLAEEKNARYRELLGTLSEEDILPGVPETLQALRARGLALAIGSSSKNAVAILERLGLSGWFDAVADGTQIKRSKPDPEVFLLAAEKLGLPAADCLVVEDAQAGIQAAQAGGMDAASVGPAAEQGIGTYQLETIYDLLALFK